MHLPLPRVLREKKIKTEVKKEIENAGQLKAFLKDLFIYRLSWNTLRRSVK
jgi:hypothetical protein